MMIITCKISTLDGHNRMKNFVAAVRKKTLFGGFWSVKVNSFLTSSNCILSPFLMALPQLPKQKAGVSSFNLPLTALPWLQLGQKTWQVTYSNNDNSPPRAASHHVASH